MSASLITADTEELLRLVDAHTYFRGATRISPDGRSVLQRAERRTWAVVQLRAQKPATWPVASIVR